MAKEIKDLQKLIEERAATKLKKDLEELNDFLKKHPLLTGQDIPRLYIACTKRKYPSSSTDTSTERYYEDTPPSCIAWLYPNRPDAFGNKLYDYWLPIYIERESKEFLDKLDRVQDDVNYLLDNRPS